VRRRSTGRIQQPSRIVPRNRDGKTAYEIASKKTYCRDVLFYADGTVIVVEETLQS